MEEGYDYCESRAKTPFVPKYFSGLNWRDAEHLVGEPVEVSNDCNEWYGPFDLRMISPVYSTHQFQVSCDWWVYLRTCPETYAHPTITIGDKKLPRPEIKVPKVGTEYWTWAPEDIERQTWNDHSLDWGWLNAKVIHLKESRAQEWADWWNEFVIKKIKG